ncbi:LOW QUALITY PROTEIN: hypothetical protein CRUP_005715, partial [Coryphaenoides rupestris]
PQEEPLPPKSTPMDRSECARSASHCHMDANVKLAGEAREKLESGQGNVEIASSSPENGSFNGEGKRPAKTRRRRKRSSNPESLPAGVGGAPEGHIEGKAGPAAAQGRQEPEQRTGRRAPDRRNPDRRAPDRRAPEPCTALLGLRSESASVWMDRSVYEQAEGRYHCWLALSVGGGGAKPNGSTTPAETPPPLPKAGRCPGKKSKLPPVPDSLSLAPPAPPPATPPTPDEGYQSQQPTPATPSPRAAAAPINGLPRLAVELLREVWLEKPRYDRAEAAFYQHLYGNNNNGNNNNSSSPKWASSARRSSFTAFIPSRKRRSLRSEEQQEVAAAAGVRYFLHPDSERVWLDKWRYEAAESRLHQGGGAAVAVAGARRPGRKASPVTSSTPPRDNSTTMSAVDFFSQDKVWFEKPRYDEAERRFYEQQGRPSEETQDAGANGILQDIARARENIQKSLAGVRWCPGLLGGAGWYPGLLGGAGWYPGLLGGARACWVVPG